MVVDVEELVRLSDLLDRFSDVDPTELSPGAVHRTLIGLHDVAARLQAITLRYAAVWEGSGVWSDDGSRSPAHRLARETNSAPASCRRITRLARQLESMPAVAESLSSGRINMDHIALLVGANTAKRRALFQRDELQLLSFCEELTLHEANVAVEYWKCRADAAVDPDGEEPALEDRTATWGPGVGDEVTLTATFDPVGGAVFTEAVERIEHELSVADRNDPDSTRSHGQRRLDALVELARRAMAMPDGASKPRVLVTVAVGDESFRRLCELSNGQIVAPGMLVPYATEIDVNTIIFDGPFHAIGASPQRTFTGALRRAIEIRDRSCQHPFGDHDPINRCDVDHIIPKAEGGITCQCNGELLARRRNRNVRLRNITAADLTVDHDDPTIAATRRRIDNLVRVREERERRCRAVADPAHVPR